MNTVIQAFGLVFQWDVMIAIVASAFYGLTVGALPGLSATMATALLVPVTFYLSPIAAIATIITASAMAIFSGDIPGCLLRIPGTPASAAYTDEAYQAVEEVRRVRRRSLTRRRCGCGSARRGGRRCRLRPI
ncbi:MAG: tripartite tricarboxylate transporter permease, partial [Bosea sp.]|nr:tripartite tricarboxylate transporter permease [Bosea sp. (in: a-proteobacteria)]